MKFVSLISIWISTFVLLFFINHNFSLFVLVFGPDNPTPTLYIILHQNEVEILDRAQANQRFPSPKARVANVDAIVFYTQKHIATPYENWFEIYDTESFLATKDSIWDIPRTGIPRLTPAEIDRAYAAVLEYAKADSLVTQYRPGEPPITKFSLKLLVISLVRIPILLGIPTLLAYLTHLYFRMLYRKAVANLQRQNRCLHCAYDCKDLPSPTCPECGQPHMIPN